jgi:hypothetical protein
MIIKCNPEALPRFLCARATCPGMTREAWLKLRATGAADVPDATAAAALDLGWAERAAAAPPEKNRLAAPPEKTKDKTK